MEDDDGTSWTDRPTRRRGADLRGRRRPAEAGGGPEGPKIQNWEKKSSNAPELPEQLHLKRLYQVTHRASLKTAATSSHCVQFNRNTHKLLETVLVGVKGVDNDQKWRVIYFSVLKAFDTVADFFSSGPGCWSWRDFYHWRTLKPNFSVAGFTDFC